VHQILVAPFRPTPRREVVECRLFLFVVRAADPAAPGFF
jgi:hypothetical protein